jgi:hypothetical protein
LSIPVILAPHDGSDSSGGSSDEVEDDLPPLPPPPDGDPPLPEPPAVPVVPAVPAVGGVRDNDDPIAIMVRARRNARSQSWGGVFDIARLVPRGGVQTGWGAVCGRHSNDVNGCGRVCKKEFRYGRAGYSDEQCVVALKRWLLFGFTIQNGRDVDAQHRHVHDYALTDLVYPLGAGEDLDAELALLADG